MEVRLPYLFCPHWLLWAACTPSIFYLFFFLYNVNRCRVQIKLLLLLLSLLLLSLLLLLQAFITIQQRQTLHTWIIFYYSRQYFEQVLKWDSGSFEFYLLVCVILHECHSIMSADQGKPVLQ